MEENLPESAAIGCGGMSIGRISETSRSGEGTSVVNFPQVQVARWQEWLGHKMTSVFSQEKTGRMDALDFNEKFGGRDEEWQRAQSFKTWWDETIIAMKKQPDDEQIGTFATSPADGDPVIRTEKP